MKKFFAVFMMLITSAFSTGIAATPDIPASTTTVSCSDSAINTNNAPANLEINWEPNTINLHWYNGNTELTVPSESQSCVYDGALIPPPPLEREGYTFAGWKVRGLPDGYTKLQYIESNGNQYIDTGINESNRAVFSMNAKAKSDDIVVFIISNSDSSGYTEGFGEYLDYVAGFNQLKATGKHYYDLTYSSSGISFIYDNDGQVHETGTYKINNNKRIYLFGISAPGYDRHISAKLYYLKLYNNGSLVRNFIPARRNSNNRVGLYDTVTKTFFTNSGTGSFTAGPVVQ